MPDLCGNKGEWSEIYIFLKLMSDGKVYAADKNMNRLTNVFLNIIKIIREEYRNQKCEYYIWSYFSFVQEDFNDRACVIFVFLIW